jgi:cellobiose epimerase
MRRLLILVMLAAGPASALAQEHALSSKYGPRMEQILRDNIVKFWDDRCLDRKNGGYVINFDLEGKPNGNSSKLIVTQARMVWFYSRLARAGYDEKKNLDAADLGYRFLRDRMWDAQNGGFFWEVDATGANRIRPRKHLYGQSFALYALSEYYLAGKRADVLEFTNRFFDLLESRAHDRDHGGYREFFNEDWTRPPAGEVSYMGGGPDVKLMNTHLHLMEALTTYYRASRLPLARERLLELVGIESNSVVRKDMGGCTDKYNLDWTPRLDGPNARVSYGHDIENVWLLVDACDAAGVPVRPYVDLFTTLWNYSLQYGYDREGGGFFDSGAFRQPADRRSKVWWVEAEAIVSALTMYRLTGEPRYLEVFERTFQFIDDKLIDWKNGEWFEFLTPDGRPGGGKAHPWKAAYHNGRAMIECLALLRQIR